MLDILTTGLGFAPHLVVTGGLAPAVLSGTDLLTSGLGFAPFALATGGLAPTRPAPTPATFAQSYSSALVDDVGDWAGVDPQLTIEVPPWQA